MEGLPHLGFILPSWWYAVDKVWILRKSSTTCRASLLHPSLGTNLDLQNCGLIKWMVLPYKESAGKCQHQFPANICSGCSVENQLSMSITQHMIIYPRNCFNPGVWWRRKKRTTLTFCWKKEKEAMGRRKAPAGCSWRYGRECCRCI